VFVVNLWDYQLQYITCTKVSNKLKDTLASKHPVTILQRAPFKIPVQLKVAHKRLAATALDSLNVDSESILLSAETITGTTCINSFYDGEYATMVRVEYLAMCVR
jgi:hypothetical protein